MVSKYWFKAVFAGALLALASTPGAAQDELETQPGKDWTHPHTRVSFPPSLLGIPRDVGKSFAVDDLSIAFAYGGPGQDIVTLYLTRDTNGSVPIWFSQAQRSIALRDDMPGITPAFPVASFTPPGQRVASGLKAVYAPQGHESIVSTGLAMFPIDGWQVKIRVTSHKLSAAELSTYIDRLLAGVRWPTPAQPAGAARAITDCPDRLTFAPSRDAVVGPALTAGVTSAGVTLRSADWCRDSQLENNRAVYRPVGTRDRYLLAIGDAGIGVVVQPHGGTAGKPAYYSETYFGQDVSYALAPQAVLPSPQQVTALIDGDRVVGSFKSWPIR